MYEYQHDGSERGFSSVIDLRREKVLNHLSVKDFRGTKAFFNLRYEDLIVNGTATLLKSVEETTGLKAKCNATLGKALVHHDKLSPEFIKWMNNYVDWEVESMLGYTKRGGADDKEEIADDEEDEAPPVKDEEEEDIVGKSNDEPVKQIILLGERHSGTNWIADYLNGCFDIKVSTTHCVLCCELMPR